MQKLCKVCAKINIAYMCATHEKLELDALDETCHIPKGLTKRMVCCQKLKKPGKIQIRCFIVVHFTQNYFK